MTSIGAEAFLGTVWYNNQPDGLVYAGKVAYKYKGTMPSNTQIMIEEGTLGIGDYAFYQCSDLTSVTLPSSLTTIGICAFDDCYSLESIDIPSGVTYIGGAAFSDCLSLTSLILPDGIPSIGYSFCDRCTGLTEVVIPNSVTSIGSKAFIGCTNLTNIIIPNNVTSIGDAAFGNCSGLIDVYCYADNVPTTDSYAFNNSSISSATLHVPAGSVEAYSTTIPWSNFGNIIPIEENATVDIGSSGYATYCSTHDLNFSEVSGVRAYIASGFNPSTGKLVLTRVDEVPAGEGLYLVGNPGTHNVPFTETNMLYSNFLKGVTTATTIYPTEGNYTNFILANGSHGIGFYTLSNSGQLAAGKAYLQLPTSSVSHVKAISVVFEDDDATAIQDIEGCIKAESIYNLQGQRVNSPKRGLYIINGQKVLIK